MKPLSGKLYYTISEVSEILGITKSQIRYWENEFDTIKPLKNARGDRKFTVQNIDQIRVIFHLVKEKGFTLEGAKQELKRKKKNTSDVNEVIQSLQNLKSYLINLREKL
jgi:DNA-binding transcriptional MerR regulator